MKSILIAYATTEGHSKKIAQHIAEIGWTPQRVWLLAGALPYPKMRPNKRMLIRPIVKKEGGDIDTSRNYEYTDWQQLDDQMREFLHHVEAGTPADHNAEVLS